MRRFFPAFAHLVLVLVWASACAGRRPPDVSRATVQRIHFEGNSSAVGAIVTGRGDGALRSAMEQGKNPRFTWLVKPRQRRVFLDRDTLELDAWRIETWYAHRGFFDARVVSWDVRQVKPALHLLFWHRPPVVRITGRVKEGRPSLVTQLRWEGLEALGGAMISHLEDTADLRVGQPVDVAELHATEDLVLGRLREQGYAFATVTSEIDVDADAHEARVVVRAVTGPVCSFGPVRISGTLPVPEAYVRDEVQIEEGSRYRASDLSRTQRRLFGLGIFSVVNVMPDLSNPASDVVPVRVELAPSKARQLRLGAGVLLESGKQDVHVSGDFEHVNLFRRLVRLETGGRVGYTTIAQIGALTEDGLGEIAETAGPTTLVTTSVVVPRVPFKRWEIFQTAAYEVGVEPGYRFRTPTVSPGLRGQLTRHLSLELAWNLKYFEYLDLDPTRADLRRTPLALDFSNPYTLSYLRQQLTWDRRDNPLFPRQGLMTTVGLHEAGGLVGGQYNYLRLEGDQRIYVPIRRIGSWSPRGTLAARIGGGIIQPYGSDPARARVPFAERLFLGGASDVRGWPRRQLGPYLYTCGAGIYCLSGPATQLADGFGGDIIPIGGLVSMNTTLEARLFNVVLPDAGFAVFSDAGMVWNSVQAARAFTLLPTVGAGLRYQTPVGPLRLDVGYRVLDPPEFAHLSRIGVHFSLSEAF